MGKRIASMIGLYHILENMVVGIPVVFAKNGNVVKYIGSLITAQTM